MHKNTIILIILIGGFLQFLNGQENKRLSNHIGLNVISLDYLIRNNSSDYYKLSLPSGIVFKKDYSKVTSRILVDYNRSKETINLVGPDSYYGTNYYTDWSIDLGIQKYFNTQIIKIYYGLDILNMFSFSKSELQGGINGLGYEDNSTSYWIGISPLCGLQYDLTSRISLSIESSYNLAFEVFNSDNRQSDSENSVDHYFNPINSFCIYYNF